MIIKTAILVDGGFYRRRASALFSAEATPAERADELDRYCKALLNHNPKESTYLYRVFYYDCPPTSKKVYHPGKRITEDFGKSSTYLWMNAFLDELKKKRKFALRMGVIAEEQVIYNLKYDVLKKLFAREITVDQVKDEDFYITGIQKGVDMKLGLDIASLAYKKQVDRIILISGDSDFVPAAKLARREGIDIILDPMSNHIRDDLFEHIDGIRSKCTSFSRHASAKETRKQV